ncbi:MAG: Holliday junction branch migration protein RuvA [Chloroflexi bacterium]|nr:Holliday junction branch migration protein RuvA [Chloroflexota bacterium]
MIASLHGTLHRIYDDGIVVLVSGVGFRVQVPASLINQLGRSGDQVDLYTYLAVREDSLTLYGFRTEEDRHVFEMLLAVQGVGPRLALSFLNALSPEMLATAVQNDEPDVIARVPGVGKKTAQKVILEL